MAPRKEMQEAAASASKTRADIELEDESWKDLPHYIAVYSRKREAREKGEPLYLDIKSTMAHCMQVETGFLSQDGISEVFEKGFETLRKWNAYIRKFFTDSKIEFSISEFVKTAKWKLVVKWPRWLFRAYGPRFATPEEKATFNFVRSLRVGLLDFKRIETKVKDTVGKSSKWLDDDRDHLLSPQDVWNRIRIELNISDEFNQKVVVLRGSDPTVIITEGLANGILLYRLINEYCQQLNKEGGHILYAELADGGLFDLSVMARTLSSWHCGIEALAIIALDLEMKERANVLSPQRPLLAALTGVPRLIGDNQYPIERDIVLVECSCSNDILERMKGEKAKSLGQSLQTWKRQNAEWRVPVLLEFGSTSVAFRSDPPKDEKEAKKQTETLNKFIETVLTVAGECDIDTGSEPLRVPQACDYRDGTLEVCQADVDTFGACRIFSNLDDESQVPNPLPLRVAQWNVLLICAQIALLQGPEEQPGMPTYFPRVVKLTLSDAFGTVLAYHVDVEDPGIYPEGYEQAQLGVRKEWRYMRSSILEYLGKNGILVGFNVTWVLTALQLALNASRVIDIGEEPAFQRWCRQLAAASKKPQLAECMTPNLKIAYDSRWPAILQAEPLELTTDGKLDIFKQTHYTAAVWQVVRARVAEDRARYEVFYAKSLYKVGCGIGFSDRDLLFLLEDQELIYRRQIKQKSDSAHWPAVSDLAATPLATIAQVEEAPSHPILWPGEHVRFLNQCSAMLQRWRDQVLPGDSFPRDFGNHANRSQVAVNMSIGSMKIHDDAGLVVAWINRMHLHSCAQLATIDPTDEKFRTEAGRNLIVCFADLAFQPAWFDYACGPRPPFNDPTSKTEGELLLSMKADPLRGAPHFFSDKLAEVPAHFITPPPRKIRTPLPILPRIPIIPREVPGQKKPRRWVRPPGDISSYGRPAHTSEESAAEEEAATAKAAAATAAASNPEAAKAAELRERGAKWTEALYQAQKKCREKDAAKKAAAEARAVSPPPAPSTPEPRAREPEQPPSPRRSPRKPTPAKKK